MTPNHLNGERPAGKSSGAASTLDVADALRAMRSRSPEESLGVKGEPGLLKSSVQAGVVTAVLFALLTAGPYAMAKMFPPAPKTTKPTTADTPAPKDAPATPSTAPETVAKKTPETPAVPGKTPAKGDILNKLGETGTKKGTPSDPFNKADDDLLKDLK